MRQRQGRATLGRDGEHVIGEGRLRRATTPLRSERGGSSAASRGCSLPVVADAHRSMRKHRSGVSPRMHTDEVEDESREWRKRDEARR